VAALRAAGFTVRGLDLTAPRAGYEPDEMVIGSLNDREVLDQACANVDVVVHLAALMSWDPRDDQRLFDANVQGTFHLLAASRQANVGRFVFASSGEVYPELNFAYLPIDENHPTRPTSSYGLTKLLGEEMVRRAGRAGLSFTILRFSHTQIASELLDSGSFFSGPRFYVNAKIRQLKGFPPSPPILKSIEALEAVATEQEQHYIGCAPDGTPYRMGMCDARDMAQGIILGSTHEAAAGETFHIGPAQSFNFDEAVLALAQVTGLPVQRVALHTASYRYDTTIEKAQRILGYTPRYDIFGMIQDAAQAQKAT
jgi:UDP-glucose 4-epimerase